MPTKRIAEIIELVEKSEWILPTFQRKYVWDQEQICDLFDSIMRSYPISTFMIWKVNKTTAGENKFYKFIQDYQEWWREIGEPFLPKIDDYYYAVIDGQQRINSLYIGYHGSYAVRLPGKRKKKAYDESIQPKTYLYLNLLENADESTSRCYDFRFFSDVEMNNQDNKKKWYRVGDILDYSYLENDDFDDSLPNLIDEKEILKDFTDDERKTALKKLKMLYKKTFNTPVINYYQEETQNLERVVDVFLRANGGGTPLEFSDLVMSVTTSQWPESRDKIEELIKLIYAETGITLNKDFVLKVFLVLFSGDISFKVKNFEDSTTDLVNKAKTNFDKIYQVILGTCKFANQIGLNNETLRSKYALIPIIYYSYKNDFEIDNISKGKDNKKLIEVWIKSALLKSMFGGKPDAVLTTIKKIIDTNAGNFPTKEIIAEYKNKTKDISIDRDFIEDRIETSHYGSPEAYLLLSLAINLDPQQRYNVDHMYPKDMFKKTELNKLSYLSTDKALYDYYANKANWNTVGNLQLLNDSENKSKNKTKLSEWTRGTTTYTWSDYFIPKDDSGNYIVQDDKFKEFVELRKKLLADAIMNTLTV